MTVTDLSLLTGWVLVFAAWFGCSVELVKGVDKDTMARGIVVLLFVCGIT